MMNDDDRAALAEAAVAAANALDRQQGVFGFGTIRPIGFPPVAIRTGPTGGSISSGLRMLTDGKMNRLGWCCLRV